MTIPDLIKTLSGLYLIVDSRISVFKKLLQLQGRVDLILSQVNIMLFIYLPTLLLSLILIYKSHIQVGYKKSCFIINLNIILFIIM